METPRRKLFDALLAEREAKTRREQHGQGELVLYDGVPSSASGCLLPDGASVAATCLTRRPGIPDGERVWSRPVGSRSPLNRRGYLRIVPGVAIEFLDAPKADLPGCEGVRVQRVVDPFWDDLVRSERLRELVRGSDLFARLLYAALSNTTWARADGVEGEVSWRAAGDLVADLRGEGCYLDWYCAGGEGRVDEVVLAEMQALGWDLSKADNPASR